MAHHRRRTAPIAALVLASALIAGPAPAAKPVTPALTPKLDQLLREEMQAILEAMNRTYEALVTGDHTTVAEQAQAIHDSFILKRELTDADRKALKEAVPKRFLKMDRQLHTSAAELAEAARAGSTQRELAIFQRMTHACVQCHTEFVGDRFPAINQPQ